MMSMLLVIAIAIAASVVGEVGLVCLVLRCWCLVHGATVKRHKQRNLAY
jgi:hypothetical protein